jgi:hypothetical protein
MDHRFLMHQLVKSDTALVNFAPEDLAFMRRTFNRACRENPRLALSEEDRQALAKAIVSAFQIGMEENELIRLAISA